MTRTRSAAPAIAPTRPAPRGQYVDLASLAAKVTTARDWFAEGALEGSPLVLLAGGEGAGKSWILADLVIATIAGQAWLGKFPVRRPGEVVVLDGEYGELEYCRRLVRLCRGRGLDPAVVLPRVRYVYSTGVALERTDATLKQLQQDCESGAIDPALIVLDPLANHLPEGADENSARDVLAALKVAGIFRDGLGCPFVISHHLNNEGKAYGSRRLRTRTDLVIRGSDEPLPWYSAEKSRTLRDSDPIKRRFAVDFRHEHDEDDAKASTTLVARFAGDRGRPKAALSRTTLRVLATLRTGGGPLTTRQIRNATKLNNPTATQSLEELRGAGMVQFRDGAWTLTLTDLGDQLKAGSNDPGIDPGSALTRPATNQQKTSHKTPGQKTGSVGHGSNGSLPVGETRFIDPGSEPGTEEAS